MNYVNAFIISLQFLTRIPVPVKVGYTEENVARSLLFYPLVGVVVGGVLVIGSMLLPENYEMLVAALVLTLWVLITGGLHLDGLADSADAWVGSHGDRLRALDIMKDPQSGPIAVVVLMLTLLIKFGAIYHLLFLIDTWVLILAPVLSRATPLFLFLSTPYVREQGLGSAMTELLPRKAAGSVLLLVGIVVVLLMGVINGIILLVVSLLITSLLRYVMLKQIGGMTGDTLGATIEITEAMILCVLVFVAL